MLIRQAPLLLPALLHQVTTPLSKPVARTLCDDFDSEFETSSSHASAPTLTSLFAQELGADAGVIVLETVAQLSLLPSQRLLTTALSITASSLHSLAPARLLSLLSAIAQLGLPPGPAFLATSFHLLTAHIPHMPIAQLQPLLATAAGLLLPRREDEAGSTGRRGAWEPPPLGSGEALASGAADIIPWPFWAAVFRVSGTAAALTSLQTAEVSALLVAVSKLQPQPPQQWLDAVLTRYSVTVQTDVTGVLTASLDALARCGVRSLPAAFTDQVLLRLRHRSVLHTLKPLHFAQLLNAVHALHIPLDPSLASALLQQLHSVLPEYRPGPPLVNTLAFLHVLLQPGAAAQQRQERTMQQSSQQNSQRRAYNDSDTRFGDDFSFTSMSAAETHSAQPSSGSSKQGRRLAVAPLSAELRLGLLTALYGSLKRYNASDLTSVLASLVKLRVTPDSAWLNEFLTASRGVLHRFEGQQLAVLLWSLASVGATPNPRWMEPVLAHASGRLAGLQPRYLAILLWGVAKMGTLPDAHWMGHALERSSAAFRASDASSLSLTVWAVARIGFRPSTAWLSACCDATRARMGTADAHSLSVTLWSLVVKLGHAPPQAWMEAWLRAVAQRAADTFSTQDIANCSTALARLGTTAGFRPHDAWLAHFCATSSRVISQHVSQLRLGAESSSGGPTLRWSATGDSSGNSQRGAQVQDICRHAAVLTHSLASMHLVSPAFAGALLPTLTPLLRAASPGSLAMMLAACVKLKAANTPPADAAGELLSAALSGGAKVLTSADSQSLASLHWALAKLGTDPGDKWWQLLESTVTRRVEHATNIDDGAGGEPLTQAAAQHQTPSAATPAPDTHAPAALSTTQPQQQEARFGLTPRCRATLLYALAMLTSKPGSSDGGGRRGALRRSLPGISHSNRDQLRAAAPRMTSNVTEESLLEQDLGTQGAPKATVATQRAELQSRRLRQHTLIRLLLPPVQQLPYCSTQDLAMTLWALPRLLHWAPPSWLNACVAHIGSPAILSGFSPQSLTMLAWGLASLQHRVRPEMAAAVVMAAAATQQVHAGPEFACPQQSNASQLALLANPDRPSISLSPSIPASASSLAAATSLEPSSPSQSHQGLQAFSPHSLTLLLWSAARWGHASALDPFLPAALSISRAHMSAQLHSGAGVLRMLWAMATLYGKVLHCGSISTPAQVTESKRWARRAGGTARKLRSRLLLGSTLRLFVSASSDSSNRTAALSLSRMRRRRTRLLRQLQQRKQSPLYRDVRDAARPRAPGGRVQPTRKDTAWVAAGSSVFSPWLATAASELIRLSHTVSTQRLTVGLWALSLLGFVPGPAWVASAELVVESRLAELGVSTLSTCLAAASKLGLDVTGSFSTSSDGKPAKGPVQRGAAAASSKGAAMSNGAKSRGKRVAVTGGKPFETALRSRPGMQPVSASAMGSESPSKLSRRPLFVSEAVLAVAVNSVH